MEYKIVNKVTRGKLVGKELEILKLYFEKNYNFKEISNIFKSDEKMVAKIIKNNNINNLPYTPPNKSKKTIGKEIEIIEMYLQGSSSYTIAKKFGVTYPTITTILKRHNVAIRDRFCARSTDEYKSKTKGRRTNFSPEDITNIKKLYTEDGVRSTEIGKMYNCQQIVIKELLIENGVDYLGHSGLKTEHVKRKTQNTIDKKYGGWKKLNAANIERLRKERGDDYLYEMKIKSHINRQKSGLRYKKAIIDGVEIMYQGYELKAIYKLINEGYTIKDLIIGKSNVPSFIYTHDGKKRHYFPDIYIPKDNRIVEVKSIYFYEKYLDKNLLKRDAVLNAGYKFDFYIMDKKDIG